MPYNADNAEKFLAGYMPGYVSYTGKENEFSYSACDCCNSKLGGKRYEYACTTSEGDTFLNHVCEDCRIYIEYGDLPIED